MDATIIYVLGAPGAGKGTICPLLAQNHANTYHLSIGDHLRSLLDLEPSTTIASTFGGLGQSDFSTRMQRRELLPAKTIISIATNAINSIVQRASTDCVNKPTILVDGFPRSLESAKLADDALGAPHKVLFFDLPREIAEARFLDRKRSADDGRDVFAMRYAEFERLNGLIIERYSDRVVRVGTELGTETTWERVRQMEQEIFGGVS